jgi:putative DNA methylase
VEITAKMVVKRPDLKPYQGNKLTVIAWLWARTVKSPNPAFSNVEVPLVGSFVVSTKRGNEAYVEPIVDGADYRFSVKRGIAPEAAATGTKAGSRGATFRCVLSGAAISAEYIRTEAKASRMGVRLLAVVVDVGR